MTDTNTPAEAVERVAGVLDNALGDLYVDGDLMDMNDVYNLATAAIETHTAYLWEQWYSDKMSEEFQDFMETMDPDPNEIAEFVLKYLLGPQKEATDADR